MMRQVTIDHVFTKDEIKNLVKISRFSKSNKVSKSMFINVTFHVAARELLPKFLLLDNSPKLIFI